MQKSSLMYYNGSQFNKVSESSFFLRFIALVLPDMLIYDIISNYISFGIVAPNKYFQFKFFVN